MGRYYARQGYKIYIQIPGGEIQIGLKSRRVRVWFRGKIYTIKKGLPSWVWLDPRWEKRNQK